MVALDSKDRSRNAIHYGLRPHKRKHRLHIRTFGTRVPPRLTSQREKNTAYSIYPWALGSSRSTESTTPLRCPFTKKHTDQTISLPPYRGVRLANQCYTQSRAILKLRFDHHPPNFAFQQKSGSLHLSMPQYQSISYHWFLPIYNLWAHMSQRRALSKRINSPPPNRYIFSRDQQIQYKGIQCQTHHLFTSPF